jgi:hypothetical protein
MVYLMKAQEQNPFEMPESTPGYHFAAFFISGKPPVSPPSLSV